jgi:CDP-diacylglycerol--glycerol-3-phosphate 3-phosphatidyltransferase
MGSYVINKAGKINVPNLLSFYRIIVFPLLIILIIIGNKDVFKWLIGICFFTDFIDGFIARKLKMTSKVGSKLDSIGDMLTLVAACSGFVVFEKHFVANHLLPILIAMGLYILQLIICLIKFKKPSSFHTYSAKISFIIVGTFFIVTFFAGVINWLFWLAIGSGILECVEEISIAFLLPELKQNVKSIFHVVKNSSKG